MAETDYFVCADLQTAVAMMQDLIDQIKEEDPTPYEIETYNFEVPAGDLISLNRVFFLDYERGRIDYELEILKTK